MVTTMTDSSLQQAVLDELNWQPSVKAANIGVTAKDGVVTLTGHVGSMAEKWAAERAVSSVFGVKAVAEESKSATPSKRRKTMRTSPSGRFRFSLGISRFPTTK